MITVRRLAPVLWFSACLGLSAVSSARPSAAPAPGKDATAVGIYYRYPDRPTTHEAALDDMRALGVQHLVFWLSTAKLYAPNAVDGPEFARFAALLRERGLTLNAGVGTMLLWNKWAQLHPDWVMQDADGKPNPYNYPCWSNPDYARFSRRITERIVRAALAHADDVISSWFVCDEPLWGWGDYCFCKWCHEGYRAMLRQKGYRPADVGFKSWDAVRLATNSAQANNALHAITTCLYREDQMTAFLAGEADLVRQLDPKHRAVTTSGLLPAIAARWGPGFGQNARKFERAFDFTMTDPYLAGDPLTNYSLQEISRVMATLYDPTRRVPSMLIVQDFANTAPGNVLPIPSQMRKLCFMAIGNGGTGLVPFIYDCGLQRAADGRLTQESYPKHLEFGRIANWLRDPLVSDLLCRAQPLTNVAVVFPQNWYRRYGPDQLVSLELEREFTIFNDLVQNHYSVRVIFPEDLANAKLLAQYQAIVATGVWDATPEFGVTAGMLDTVRRYVADGGALLESGRSGLVPLATGVRAEKVTVNWRGDSLEAISRAAVTAQPGDRILARYDDGGDAALVRRMGEGRLGVFPSVLYPERQGDGGRYDEKANRYVFDQPDGAATPRAAAVREAVGDMFAALRVPRPLDLRDERGRRAWFVQPMILQGDGYRLLVCINWDRSAHDLRLRMTVPAGRDWALTDFLTGEHISATRGDLASGLSLKIGGGEVRALAIAWDSRVAHRLRDWRPTHPYTPVAD